MRRLELPRVETWATSLEARQLPRAPLRRVQRKKTGSLLEPESTSGNKPVPVLTRGGVLERTTDRVLVAERVPDSRSLERTRDGAAIRENADLLNPTSGLNQASSERSTCRSVSPDEDSAIVPLGGSKDCAVD
jgi:hypothetical protein